ncbi:PREDICTED: PRUPE_7G197400 [Prunus dulcis]|uniref:PREDICTED: PRUPE_7G197400 n=1 Tax=Prunus dulcis TaxID=3755 RepID=A0A5E4E8T2_PRUDU|nr:PREDICTED: PRUPE_7G197400 [Prunus dulcis]
MELHPPTMPIDIEISAVDKQNICLLTNLINRLIRCIYPLHGVSASITHLPRDELLLLLLLIAKNQLPNVKKKQQQEDKKEVIKKANHKTVAAVAVAVAAAAATITTFLSLVSPSLTFLWLHDYVYAFVPRHSFSPTQNFKI